MTQEKTVAGIPVLYRDASFRKDSKNFEDQGCKCFPIKVIPVTHVPVSCVWGHG